MKSISLSKSGRHFMIYGHEKNALSPFFILPTVWFERRHQGLRVTVRRWTFTWGCHRFHCGLGAVSRPVQGPWSNPSYQLDGFHEWAKIWLSKSWPQKISWDRTSFEKWLDQSDHKQVVAWGGASFHYSRILLAREYVSQEASSPSKTFGAFPQNEDMDVELSLTMDLSPPPSGSSPAPNSIGVDWKTSQNDNPTQDQAGHSEHP